MPDYDALLRCLQVLEELLYDITEEEDFHSPLSVSVQETLAHVVGLMKKQSQMNTE